MVASIGILTAVDANAATPASLQGESFSSVQAEVVADCDPDGTSIIEVQSTGLAAGPYPGTFEETVTAVIGPQDNTVAADPSRSGGFTQVGEIQSYESSFTITSDAGSTLVTGTRTFAGPDPQVFSPVDGTCHETEIAPDIDEACDGSAASSSAHHYIANSRYEVSIHTAEGLVSDHGKGLAHFIDVTGTCADGREVFDDYPTPKLFQNFYLSEGIGPNDPPPVDGNVDICHANVSQQNPYTGMSPTEDDVVSLHADHSGPVFFPEADSWGDIIPPFDYGDDDELSFPGLNWNAEGQEIYFNDCDVPAAPEPPGSAEEEVTGGETVTTDHDGTGPTAEVPVQTEIVVPEGTEGTISVHPEPTGSPPSGFSFFDHQLDLSGPAAASAEDPYVVTFALDASLLGSTSPGDVQVFRDGALVSECTHESSADPDPCVVDRRAGDGGDALVTVRTTQFSDWNFAANRAPDVGAAKASPNDFRRAAGQFKVVGIIGVTDPDGDLVTLEITKVTQDERVRTQFSRRAPDAEILPTPGTVNIRAECEPLRNGRVYEITFKATDTLGASTTGTARVGVRCNAKKPAIDSGQKYNSLQN